MMKRAKGVTLAEIVAATGWQKHSVRGLTRPLYLRNESPGSSLMSGIIALHRPCPGRCGSFASRLRPVSALVAA
jgi:hypothetical protein